MKTDPEGSHRWRCTLILRSFLETLPFVMHSIRLVVVNRHTFGLAAGLLTAVIAEAIKVHDHRESRMIEVVIVTGAFAHITTRWPPTPPPKDQATEERRPRASRHDGDRMHRR